MQSQDIEAIESELQIVVPANLRSIWENYPIPGALGNCEHCIWDSAKSIIAENNRLRAKRGWPKELLFIGDDGAGNQYAVDLNNPQIPIGIEFEDVARRYNPVEGLSLQRETIAGWFTFMIKERVDDGYDLETGKYASGMGSSILIIAIGMAFIGFLFWFVRFVTNWADGWF